MLDLYNREIVGYAAGGHKDAKLVRKALYSIKYDLRKISLFHTDYAEEKTIPKFWIRKMKIA